MLTTEVYRRLERLNASKSLKRWPTASNHVSSHKLQTKSNKVQYATSFDSGDIFNDSLSFPSALDESFLGMSTSVHLGRPFESLVKYLLQLGLCCDFPGPLLRHLTLLPCGWSIPRLGWLPVTPAFLLTELQTIWLWLGLYLRICVQE